MAALLLVLLVATGEADTPATQTTVRVAREALDGSATIIVREVAPASLTDAEATRIRTELHADSVVVLTWPDPLRRTALVHARVAREGDWTDRYVTFSVSDPVSERGRTLGFEIASMIPGRWSARPRVDAKPDGAKPDGTKPDGAKPDGVRPDGVRPDGVKPDGTTPDGTRPDSTRPDGTRPDGTKPDPSKADPSKADPSKADPSKLASDASKPPSASASASDVKLEPPSSARSARARPMHVSLEMLGLAAAGNGAGGFGGDAAARLWGLDGSLAGRLVVGGRFGDVPDAGASSVIVRVGGGLALRVLRPTPEQRFGLGLRVDGLGLWQRVARADSSSSGARLMPGADLMLEASWQAASALAVLVNVGAEASLGDTTILVDARPAATIAPVRGVAEVGLRWEP